MNIHSLKINHITRPLGYLYKTLTASYITESSTGKRQESARIMVARDTDFTDLVFDTGKSSKVSGLGTPLSFPMEPQTCYYWKVQVWDDMGNTQESGTQWFETGLMETGFKGQWISPDLKPAIQPVFVKEFELDKIPESARLYMSCLGVYELYLNGNRVGDEILAPGLTVYEHYVQYQTYDIGSMLRRGKNVIEVTAGDGWYKGLYGYRQNNDYRIGKAFELIADLYVDGELVLCTDLSWQVKKSKIIFSDIYDGEYRDDTLDDSIRFPVKAGSLDKGVVKERLGLPVKVKEILKPKAVITTPKGETVLDMGQNMVGWIAFKCLEEKGTKISLEHGEVLQDGCFYNKNYRTAKARYDYISDGQTKTVHACLTFFGFQYVKITGIENVRLEDFQGEVLYSDLEETGWMKTGNKDLNQLISNIIWSQKGNFLDIPTDCPQRDEKMGWTGDAQIFAGTACLNMDCYEFFRKYLNDISLEQADTNGLVPQIVPSVGRNERTSAAWGDAAVIIPWVLYQYYGDSGILAEQYESMEAWIAYIDRQNSENGTDPNLWKNGFHYGDWLALDGGCYHMPTGGTDVFYISSAYFYYSVKLLAKSAGVLGKDADCEKYSRKAEQIRNAILKEYFTANGKLSIDTQAAYTVSIVFELIREKAQLELIKEQFLLRIRKDGYSLKTGFVGTPFILEALSRCGRSDLAFRILLDKECPGWLYPVTLGATTMWERWGALNPDGSMSDSGMNSLNHYANGSVQEWMYARMAGITPQSDGAGFKRVLIQPQIHPGTGWMDTVLKTAAGLYKIHWEIQKENRMLLTCSIPFDATAEIILPCCFGKIILNGEEQPYQTKSRIPADAGVWVFEYKLSDNYCPCYHLEDSVKELVRNPVIKEYLYKKVPMLVHTDGAEIQNMTLAEMSKLPFFLGIGTRLGLDVEVLEEIEGYVCGIGKW
ncbi:family 78 glycoside hydrolase catalytic domain [uncultured Robinsoniella sp.]|uniref:family 78 glycoside hydrolase catalytic domain n=1 Tax=uncultured Robinsoniella sp. TaxID=904190 RepID=UPI00374FCD88